MIFPDAPEDVVIACDKLQQAVIAGEYLGGLETFLGVRVEVVSHV